jgi:ribosome biogenesis GTPase A
LIVEVRDARIPLTSINKEFDEFIGNRKRLVIYNKADLSNSNFQQPITEAFLKHQNLQVAFTKATTSLNIQIILNHAIQICKADPVRFPYLSMVVVGCPNVGKSTLINSLRNLGCKKGKVTQGILYLQKWAKRPV